MSLLSGLPFQDHLEYNSTNLISSVLGDLNSDHRKVPPSTSVTDEQPAISRPLHEYKSTNLKSPVLRDIKSNCREFPPSVTNEQPAISRPPSKYNCSNSKQMSSEISIVTCGYSKLSPKYNSTYSKTPVPTGLNSDILFMTILSITVQSQRPLSWQTTTLTV